MNRYKVVYTIHCGPGVMIPCSYDGIFEATDKDALVEMLRKRSPHIVIISITEE